jgi:hypothetical protein
MEFKIQVQVQSFLQNNNAINKVLNTRGLRRVRERMVVSAAVLQLLVTMVTFSNL